MAVITISSYTTNPTAQLSVDDALEVRGFYLRDFVAADGVTAVFGGDGQSGPYYSITPTLVSGNLVVPAHDVQPTTESNPTGLYIEQLWVNGAYSQTLMPNNNVGTGWAIPTVYGDPIAYDEIATYNRARRLVYPPAIYFTADETIAEIRRLAGDFMYAAVGVNGITSMSVAPVDPSLPIAVGNNDPRLANLVSLELGTATLVAGAVTVSFPTITAASQVFPNSRGGLVTGSLRSSINVGVGFTITSTNGADSGAVGYAVAVIL